MSEVVKQHDTDPITWELADADGPIDLTGATVTIEVYGPQPSALLKFSGVCPVVGPGLVRQTPAPAHFDVDGHYSGVLVSDWGAGRVRRFPSEGFLPIRVDPASP